MGVSLTHALKRAVVWAPLLALVLAGLNLPSSINRSLAVVGSSADASALVLTGLVVSAQKFQLGADTLFPVVLKNALQPAVTLAFAVLLHLSLTQTRYVTLIGAMPCGFFGVLFGQDFGSCPRLASSSLMASYAIGIGTLAVWIAIVTHLR